MTYQDRQPTFDKDSQNFLSNCQIVSMSRKKNTKQKKPSDRKQTKQRTCKKTSRKRKQKNTKKYTYDPDNVKKLTLPVRCYEICHDKFLTYEEITTYLDKMKKKFPHKLQLQVIGKSVENRPIYLVCIANDSEDAKMSTIIEAGSDGTNKLAIASALYLIDFIAKNKYLVNLSNYLIIPCSNPDAYDNHVKNCKENPKIPSDLTNNFPIVLGASNMDDITTECFLKVIKKWKMNFRYNAPTTTALYRALNYHQNSVKLFVSLQENGTSLAYPFGCCTGRLLEEEELESVAQTAQAVVKRIELEIGPLYDVSGLIFGSVIDFIQFHCKQIKFTYVFNIKDKRKCSKAGEILMYGEDVVRCVKSLVRNVFMRSRKSGSQNKCS